MTEAPHINIRDLSKFPRPVARVVADAVNKHGVNYRMMGDGVHLRLYNGNPDVTPFKVSASRPAEPSLKYLIPWLEEHVETWKNAGTTGPRVVTTEVIERLADAVNTNPKPERPEPTATSEGWEPTDHGFETDGTTYRCTKCDYSKTERRGIHLHAITHEDPEGLKQRGKSGGEAAQLRHKQRVTMRQEAVRVLAQQNGLVVFEKGAVADAKYVARLEKELAEVTAQRDDYKARLDLMREAMRA